MLAGYDGEKPRRRNPRQLYTKDETLEIRLDAASLFKQGVCLGLCGQKISEPKRGRSQKGAGKGYLNEVKTRALAVCGGKLRWQEGFGNTGCAGKKPL